MGKRHVLYAIVLLLALGSCSKEAQQETGSGKQQFVRFTSVVEGTYTRAAGASWSPNDQIGVFMKQSGEELGSGTIIGDGDNISYVTKSGDGNFSPNGMSLEYPSDGSAVDFIAYYPFQTTLDNYIYKVDIADQSKPEKIDLLYADNLKGRTQTSVTGNLQFYHQLSQLVLNISSSDNTDFSNLTVSISGVKTKADFNLVDGALTVDEESEAVVNMRRTGNAAEAILLPTSTVNGIKLTLTLNGKAKEITLPSSITSLEKKVKYTFSVNIKNGGSQVDPEEVKYAKWRETPVITKSMLEKSNIHYINHYMPNDKKVRNYSLLYDSDLKMAYWVAYPLCSYYTTGTGKRTDDWGFDPEISSNLQFNFGKKSGSNLAESSKYDRGHQLPSADRLHDNEVNETTFYSTNITPQINRMNQQIWQHLEDQVRKWTSGVDTVFVVTGAMVDKDNVEYTTAKSDGGSIAVPKYYFKALARKLSSTGVFYTIAFKIDNTASVAGDNYMEYAVSVDALERLTGFTFFPSVNADIKATLDKSKWQ